ncbi:hypothetical protein B0H65DRAFT_263386 [Neurospora tetraspora]|uniref:Secreted protein n=1 Tax=Neurospora tetraspora TaxID=94610 RepID=A0AAE0JAR9_9PEZI|nr:hypothetical protein B0H65DRAFT_263386 [Neurospora tetraspora]
MEGWNGIGMVACVFSSCTSLLSVLHAYTCMGVTRDSTGRRNGQKGDGNGGEWRYRLRAPGVTTSSDKVTRRQRMEVTVNHQSPRLFLSLVSNPVLRERSTEHRELAPVWKVVRRRPGPLDGAQSLSLTSGGDTDDPGHHRPSTGTPKLLVTLIQLYGSYREI